MTITEFILARVEEDEAAALHGDGGILDMEDAWFSTSRVLAECEAKRRIVEEAFEVARHERRVGDMVGMSYEGDDTSGERILRALAAIWADHPDYQPQWAPDGS